MSRPVVGQVLERKRMAMALQSLDHPCYHKRRGPQPIVLARHDQHRPIDLLDRNDRAPDDGLILQCFQERRGERTAPRRHQSLRALIDWSHDLLTPDERLTLAHLAVFTGTWAIEAAEFVCGDGGTEAGVSGGVLDVIGRLVDRSLVAVETLDGARRYRLLETIRQYAEENLRASGEGFVLRERHRDWYLRLFDAAFPELNGRCHGQWMSRLSAEHDNLRVALASCRLDPHTWEFGLRLAANLGWYFISSNRFGEGGRWLDEFLARSASRDGARLCGLAAMTSLRLHRGDVSEARRHAEECVELARTLGARPDGAGCRRGQSPPSGQ
jgi:hypothetical protein